MDEYTRSRSPKYKTSAISHIKSPTMAGGVCAINITYFWDIRSYDDNMKGWGRENF